MPKQYAWSYTDAAPEFWKEINRWSSRPFSPASPAIGNVDDERLELAIAERVIRAHGSTIRAHNREDGGLQVAIVLPLTA